MTAEKASEQILRQAAEVRKNEPAAVEDVLLALWNHLVSAVPDYSFVSRMSQRRREYGFNASAIPYNIQIRDASSFPQAVDWFERMRQDGILPNVVTYNTLFAKDLSALTAEELLSWYWSQKVHPSEPLQAAISSFRKARLIDEAFRVALHYPHLQAAQKLFRDFPHQIRSYLMGVLADHPDHPDVHFALGVALMEVGAHSEAKTHLHAALATAVQKRKGDIEARLRRLNPESEVP